MKTATVRDLRNRYTRLLSWLDAGEEVLVTRRGKPVARLVPERPPEPGTVDWTASPAVRRDRSVARVLTSDESQAVRSEASGRW